MPEGHTIHRLALDLARDFEGHAVAVSSPQGRFDGVARIDGRRLTRAHAVGKHLFLDFGRARVHVHLGLFGRFRKRRRGETARATTRLRLSTPDATWDLSGATACEILTPSAFEALRARLGVDPLAEGARPTEAWKRVHASRRAIGALLLDQSVFAGIGNVYRAELLFLARLHPEIPGEKVSRAAFDTLWRNAKELLRAGVKANRIITVPGARRLHVYKRSTCHRCEGGIGRITVAARAMYYCPRCQPYPSLDERDARDERDSRDSG